MDICSAGKEDALHRVGSIDHLIEGPQPRRCGPPVIEPYNPSCIVGHALFAQFVEHGKFMKGVCVESAAKAQLARTHQVVDRAVEVRLTFLAAALTRKRFRLQATSAPNVATRTMPRMQCPERHIEPARRESGFHDATAEAIDLVVERQASQPALNQPFRNAGRIE